MLNFIQKIFGTKNERELKRIAPLIDEINRFEPAIQKLSDEALRAKTAYFREKLANGVALDDILTEAFAVVREAAWRTVAMRPFDVQLIGGIVLHEGKIAEMKTGEGKTLAATMPLYLNALTGKGCSAGYRERLPGQARCILDGADLQISGTLRRNHRAWPDRRGETQGLPLRHHLRHEQRIRVRLPAGQHEVHSRRLCPEGLPLCHCRRG